MIQNFFLFIVLQLPLFILSFSYDTQEVVWYPCPANQQSGFVKDCADIILPLNRNDLTMGNVTGHIILPYTLSHYF